MYRKDVRILMAAPFLPSSFDLMFPMRLCSAYMDKLSTRAQFLFLFLYFHPHPFSSLFSL
jgi:hypothetical protein